MRSAEAERRQAAHDIRSTEDIVIEMLRNARDAHAKSIFLAVSREGQRRRLVMIDDGDGVPAAMHERIFEPRVTSKLDSMHMDKWGIHGRGMALYSIAVNAETARVVASDAGKGAALFVETNLDKLGEKTDQSSSPCSSAPNRAASRCAAPRTSCGTACEFAIECRQRLHRVTSVRSPDSAATLLRIRTLSVASTFTAMRAFCADASELPVAKALVTVVRGIRLSFADEGRGAGPGHLGSAPHARILDGEIASGFEPLDQSGRPQSKGRPTARPAARPAKGAGGRCALVSESRTKTSNRFILATRSVRVLGFGARGLLPGIGGVKPDVRMWQGWRAHPHPG